MGGSNNNVTNSSTINSNTGGFASTSIPTGINNNLINNGHLISTRTVFKSSADERGELKMRITRETKPGKSEHKIVTSPNQKSPNTCSSSSGFNNICGMTSNDSTFNINNHVNNCDDSYSQGSSNPPQSSNISSKKECGTSTSIGTITEPECLGPCEPGTSVTLEGIVWQETEGGILVVNVTWRGKTYVGALLDCTKHDWAPPRLCDSPASDIDSKAHKGVRTKRIVTRSNGMGLDEKNLLQTTGKLRNGKGRRILTPSDLASCNKKQREMDKSNENTATQTETHVSSITNSETVCVPMSIGISTASNSDSISTSILSNDKTGPNSPMLIGCNEPNCSKKYRNMNGLLYHQAYAHGSDNDQNSAPDNNCSSSIQERPKETSVNEQEESKITSKDISDGQSSTTNTESRHVHTVQIPGLEKKRTPSPQLSMKLSNKILPPEHSQNNNAVLNQEPPRSSIIKNLDPERRSSLNSSNHSSNLDHGLKSPSGLKHLTEQGHASTNHSTSKTSSGSTSNSKQSNPIPLPATTEEGMKPSGTSTGPPPAPHQANYYFNSAAILANTAFNPYGMPPYFPRAPLPMYDPLATPPTSTASAAFLSRIMNMRVPAPPESPSRLLSPSVSKNIPFPHFKLDPVAMPAPNPQMPNPSLPNITPMTNSPLASGSPHLRMPSQVDPLLPPTSQPPFPPPVGLNPVLAFPGATNQMGPIGGPQVPSLMDDTIAKQYPRRFN